VIITTNKTPTIAGFDAVVGLFLMEQVVKVQHQTTAVDVAVKAEQVAAEL
jgi:hypothetical protein